MKQFGLIGNPISHSKSPALFKAGYNGKYTYDLIEEDNFDIAFNCFLNGYDGVNVTAPFKEKAYTKCEATYGTASDIKAVNLLIKNAEGVTGYNTDIYGVLLSFLESFLPQERLKSMSFHTDEKFSDIKNHIIQHYNGHTPTVMIMGCGGAGKAAAIAFAACGFETVIVNRDEIKARNFVASIAKYNMSAASEDDFKRLFRESDLIVYTLPCVSDGLLSLDENDYKQNKTVIEANYRNPSFDNIMKMKLSERGGKYISGERWLLYQAFSGYRIFTGEFPDIVAMNDIL